MHTCLALFLVMSFCAALVVSQGNQQALRAMGGLGGSMGGWGGFGGMLGENMGGMMGGDMGGMMGGGMGSMGYHGIRRKTSPIKRMLLPERISDRMRDLAMCRKNVLCMRMVMNQ